MLGRGPREEAEAMGLGRSTGLWLTMVFVAATDLRAQAEPVSLDEVVKRAMAVSPELRAAMASLEAARAAVDAEARRRVPVMVAGVDARRTEQFSDTAEGAILNSSERAFGNVGVQLETSVGTAIKAGLSTSSRWQTINRDPTTASSVTLGPTIAAEVTLDVTQPLLRGAGEDIVLAQWRIARAQMEVVELERQEAASAVLEGALGAAWDLWEAEQALAVERAGLSATETQQAETETRERLGTVTEMDALRLGSEASSRRQRVLSAEALLADRQLALARFLGVGRGEAGTLGTSGLVPVETGRGLDALTGLAVSSSPELMRLERVVAQARERLVAARDTAKTRVDLWGSVAMGGLWTEGPPSGLELPGGRPAISAMAGLDIELPLGPSAADAAVAEAAAEVRAAELRLEARKDVLIFEISRRHKALEVAAMTARQAEETIGIAGRLAEKEAARLKLGLGTATDVILAQQLVREAELSRVRALADAARAEVALERLAGTLLLRHSESKMREGE